MRKKTIIKAKGVTYLRVNSPIFLIIESDESRLLKEGSFIRPIFEGEFKDAPLDLKNKTHVIVRKIDSRINMRTPITEDEKNRLEQNEIHIDVLIIPERSVSDIIG